MKLLPAEVKLQNNILSLFASGEANLELMLIVKEASKEVSKSLEKINKSMSTEDVRKLFIDINSTNIAKQLFAACGVEYDEVLNDLEEASDEYYEERFKALLVQMGL